MAASHKDRWIRMLDRSRDELIEMHRFRQVYLEVGRITQANTTLPPSEVFDLIQTSYAYMQAIAIRRQVDHGNGVLTLGRTLREMWKLHPDIATAAGVEVAVVEADAQRMLNGTERVRAHVNRSFAHSAQKPPAELATFKDMHDAIDLLGEIFQRTYRPLTNVHQELDPAIQYHWQAVFEVPWLVRPKYARGN